MTEAAPSPAPADEPPQILSLTDRLLAAVGYLGGTLPLSLPWFRSWTRRDYVRQHFRQSDLLFLILFVVIFLFVVCVLTLSWVMVQERSLYDTVAFEAWTLSLFRKILIVFGVFWSFAFFSALMGSRAWLPGLQRWTGPAWISWTTRGLLAVTLVMIILLTGIGLYARRITAHPQANPKAVFLYEDVEGRFPRWLFALGYAPSLRAAANTWGTGQVALTKLTEESLYQSLNTAQFVFIGSHGTKDGILLATGHITPANVRAHTVRTGLRYVYLAHCDSGAQRTDWESALSPATVVTHDRLTPTLEHVAWLWFYGPGKIRALGQN